MRCDFHKVIKAAGFGYAGLHLARTALCLRATAIQRRRPSAEISRPDGNTSAVVTDLVCRKQIRPSRRGRY